MMRRQKSLGTLLKLRMIQTRHQTRHHRLRYHRANDLRRCLPNPFGTSGQGRQTERLSTPPQKERWSQSTPGQTEKRRSQSKPIKQLRLVLQMVLQLHLHLHLHTSSEEAIVPKAEPPSTAQQAAQRALRLGCSRSSQRLESWSRWRRKAEASQVDQTRVRLRRPWLQRLDS